MILNNLFDQINYKVNSGSHKNQDRLSTDILHYPVKPFLFKTLDILSVILIFSDMKG